MKPFFRIKKYYSKQDKSIICHLCPHNCVINDGKFGLCKTRTNINGEFFSTAYGRPSSIHIDPVEKKPLYHYMPGTRILSLGTLGCNLFCIGCQNHDISRSEVSLDEEYYTPQMIVDMALKADIKMIAYTYNEPTIFFEYMIDIAKIAKKHGIKNVMVSNGYINKEPLKELVKYIDAANIDLKGLSEKFYKDYAHAKLVNVLETLKYISKHNKNSRHKVWLEITNLIIPKHNDDMDEIEKICVWICNNVGTETPLHFSRFYPDYKAQDVNVTPHDSLIQAKNVALKNGLKYVYIGNIGSIEDTYCQKCDNLLISRQGMIRTVGLTGKKGNECSECRKILAGVFI
jgi:pyruvate formate lyase activating enzyme